MTKDQFQRETNDFMTGNEQIARDRAAKYNAASVDGYTIVAAKFGNQWCLMLDKAHAFIKELGI